MHCRVLGTRLYHRDVAEAVSAALAGKTRYNGEHEGRSTKRALADATEANKRKRPRRGQGWRYIGGKAVEKAPTATDTEPRAKAIFRASLVAESSSAGNLTFREPYYFMNVAVHDYCPHPQQQFGATERLADFPFTISSFLPNLSELQLPNK